MDTPLSVVRLLLDPKNFEGHEHIVSIERDSKLQVVQFCGTPERPLRLSMALLTGWRIDFRLPSKLSQHTAIQLHPAERLMIVDCGIVYLQDVHLTVKEIRIPGCRKASDSENVYSRVLMMTEAGPWEVHPQYRLKVGQNQCGSVNIYQHDGARPHLEFLSQFWGCEQNELVKALWQGMD